MGRFWNRPYIPGNPKVSLAIAAYNRFDPLFCLLYALRSQTHANWEAVVMHDGPCPTLREAVQGLGDRRVRFYESQERKGDWGHPLRQEAIGLCTGDFIGLSNDDNYYVPIYFEAMLGGLYSADAELAHCDMVHDHFGYVYFQTQLKKLKCDLGGWIAKASLVKATPWRDMAFDGDGTYIEDLARKAKGAVRVPMCLFCHN